MELVYSYCSFLFLLLSSLLCLWYLLSILFRYLRLACFEIFGLSTLHPSCSVRLLMPGRGNCILEFTSFALLSDYLFMVWFMLGNNSYVCIFCQGSLGIRFIVIEELDRSMAFLILSSYFSWHCCFSKDTQARLTLQAGNRLISILFQPIESGVECWAQTRMQSKHSSARDPCQISPPNISSSRLFSLPLVAVVLVLELVLGFDFQLHLLYYIIAAYRLYHRISFLFLGCSSPFVYLSFSVVSNLRPALIHLALFLIYCTL